MIMLLQKGNNALSYLDDIKHWYLEIFSFSEDNEENGRANASLPAPYLQYRYLNQSFLFCRGNFCSEGNL